MSSSPEGQLRNWEDRAVRELLSSSENLDNEHLMRMAGRFARRVRGYAKANSVDVIDCEAGERKHQIAERYLAENPQAQGVFLILVSRFFLGGIPDRIHPRITYYLGISAMAAGLLLIASGPPPVVAVLSAALLGFGFSFPWSSIISSVLKKTPSNEHGMAVGVLSAFYDLFVGISSFAAGEVPTRFGYSAAFVMAAAALLVAGALGVLVFPHSLDKIAPSDEAYLEPIEL